MEHLRLDPTPEATHFTHNKDWSSPGRVKQNFPLLTFFTKQYRCPLTVVMRDGIRQKGEGSEEG